MKKQKQYLNSKNLLIAGILVSFIAFSTAVSAISRGYATDDISLKPGMVVQLSDDSSAETPKVERASFETPDKFVGITTRVENNSVTIASSKQSVYVENEGEVDAFVSDLDGAVKQGDQLTISPLRGILAKATESSPIVVGTALEDFSYDGAENHEIKTVSGTKVASINLVRFNLDSKSILNHGGVDSSLERLGESIVGKEVSELRVVVAMIIFLLVLFAEGAILYGAISSAVTSLGRNPLARNVIKKELTQIMAVALAVLTVGLGAIYLILWV